MADDSTVEYTVGTIKLTDSKILFENCGTNIEYDSAEVKDENGNVLYVQHYNHRAVLNASAAVPKGHALPAPGQSVSVKGVVLPTVSAKGVVSGDFKLSSDLSSGTAVDFLVTSCNPTTSNSDVPKASITLTRYLENSLGAIRTSDASNSN